MCVCPIHSHTNAAKRRRGVEARDNGTTSNILVLLFVVQKQVEDRGDRVTSVKRARVERKGRGGRDS